MPVTAIYPEVTAPRWGREESEYQIAKRSPRYVYGTGRNSCLVHKVLHVKLRWWVCGPGGHYLVRLQTPRMFAETCCGMSFFMEAGKSAVCELPRPDAVPCAMCHGEGRNFPRNKPHKVPKELAKVRLGCIRRAA